MSGSCPLTVTPLLPEELGLIAWSGSATHLENVARQLQRVDRGEVEYLAARAAGLPVAKGGIDFTKESGAGTIWQLATHPRLQGLGLGARLIRELEARALHRGIRKLRLGVEVENMRAHRLYELLGRQSANRRRRGRQRRRTARRSSIGRRSSRC